MAGKWKASRGSWLHAGAVVAAAVLAVGCTETGDQGADGAEGPRGAPGAAGPAGEAGPRGEQGERGETGAPGQRGSTSLIRTSTDVPAELCPNGGIRIETGVDGNGNGILEDNEVDPDATRFVCNGVQGVQGIQGEQGTTGARGEQGLQGLRGDDGLATVFRTGAAGDACAAGGVRIQAGLDLNRNGILDDAEVNDALAQLVCNGAQGAQGIQGLQGERGLTGERGAQGLQGEAGLATVFRTTPEMAGVRCAAGGVRYEAGLDANRNGLLDDGEVNPVLTRYVCDGLQGAQGIQGERGLTGAQGLQGLRGEKGDIGATGAQGEKGDKGDTGEQGIQGIQGEQGLTGATGAQGEKGDRGDTGEQGIQGIQGEQGLTGATGAQGEKGDRGDDGFATVFRTTRVDADPACTTGGLRIEAGLDLNRNRTLDEGEEDAGLTRYVCDGEEGLAGETGATGVQGEQGLQGLQGTSGSHALVHTFWEPSSLACSYGGIRVVFGTDYDGDGELAGSFEIAGEEYVCNGAPGAAGEQGAKGDQGDTGAAGLATLVRTSAATSGDCPTGGVVLEVGLDANRNDVLDEGEVNGALTRVVCNGAQGPQGEQGLTGATGPQGPAGPPGPAGGGGGGLYGDGSAGQLVVIGVLDLTSDVGFDSLPHGANLQFDTILIEPGSVLRVPSGTILRATGFFSNAGTIEVAPGTASSIYPPAGIAAGHADLLGGRGIGKMGAANLGMPLVGGGAGVRDWDKTTGGDGGGSFVVVSPFVSNYGAIHANGLPDLHASGDPGGGGGGGVVILAGTEIINYGTIQARGGDGASRGGGGGGGGLIHLLGSIVYDAGTTSVAGGTGGAGSAGNNGYGGGGSVGNGGRGHYGGTPATSGTAGAVLVTYTDAPERILLR